MRCAASPRAVHSNSIQTESACSYLWWYASLTLRRLCICQLAHGSLQQPCADASRCVCYQCQCSLYPSQSVHLFGAIPFIHWGPGVSQALAPTCPCKFPPVPVHAARPGLYNTLRLQARNTTQVLMCHTEGSQKDKDGPGFHPRRRGRPAKSLSHPSETGHGFKGVALKPYRPVPYPSQKRA